MISLEKIERQIIDGEIDGLDALIIAKDLETIAKQIRSSELVDNSATEEIDKYTKGEKCIRNGYEFSKYIRTNYKFDIPYINHLTEEKKEFEEKIKAVQEQSKALLKGKQHLATIIDEDGTEWELTPPDISYVGVVTVKAPK